MRFTQEESKLAREIWEHNGDSSLEANVPVWCLHTARHLINKGYGLIPQEQMEFGYLDKYGHIWPAATKRTAQEAAKNVGTLDVFTRVKQPAPQAWRIVLD